MISISFDLTWVITLEVWTLPAHRLWKLYCLGDRLTMRFICVLIYGGRCCQCEFHVEFRLWVGTQCTLWVGFLASELIYDRSLCDTNLPTSQLSHTVTTHLVQSCRVWHVTHWKRLILCGVELKVCGFMWYYFLWVNIRKLYTVILTT